MVSDLLVGFIVGVALAVCFNPWKGIFWVIRQLQGQVRFLSNPKYPDTAESGTTYDKEYPNRKEQS